MQERQIFFLNFKVIMKNVAQPLFRNINIQSKNNILWNFDGQKVSGSAINSLLVNNGHHTFLSLFLRNILVSFLREINKQIMAVFLLSFTISIFVYLPYICDIDMHAVLAFLFLFGHSNLVF